MATTGPNNLDLVHHQVGQATGGAYGAKAGQFKDLESGIGAARKGAMQALQGQQQLVSSLPWQMDSAKQAGLGAIRSQGAQALGSAGAQAASQGAGGLGALQQSGLQGGVAAAQFGANATTDAAKTMMAAQGQLGSMSGDFQGLATGGYDAMQEAGGSLEAIRGAELSEARAAMAKIFEEYEGFYNTDAEEAQYEAQMGGLINEATDPVLRQALVELKKQYDAQFKGTGESALSGKT